MNLNDSIDIVIQRLKENSQLPKFQLERAAEVFLSVFLEEWLSEELCGSVKIITQEFPLKKETSHQSTNVDYLMSLNNSELLFVELKTNVTINTDQIETYSITYKNKKWAQLYEDAETINTNSKEKAKCKTLIERIEPYKHNDYNTRFIFVTPHHCQPGELEKFEWYSLRDMFEKFQSVKHPELWEKVKSLADVMN